MQPDKRRVVAGGTGASIDVDPTDGRLLLLRTTAGPDFIAVVLPGDRLLVTTGTESIETSVHGVRSARDLCMERTAPVGFVSAWHVIREDSPAPAAPNADSFAPADPSDGRALFQFASKWTGVSPKQQRLEGIYLSGLLLVGMAGVFEMLMNTDVVASPRIVTSMGLVFFAGLLGGTTFDLKWWYHSIAKGLWHVDRRAWRIFVPWVSAIVSMFVHVLFKSDLLGILNPASLDKIHNILAFGFLVGYFSDSAIAKLAEIAESLFGASRGREKSSR